MDDSESEDYSEEEYCSDSDEVELEKQKRLFEAPDTQSPEQRRQLIPTFSGTGSASKESTTEGSNGKVELEATHTCKGNAEKIIPNDDKVERNSCNSSLWITPCSAQTNHLHNASSGGLDAAKVVGTPYTHVTETSDTCNKKATYSVARMLELSKPRECPKANKQLQPVPKKELKLGKTRLNGFLERMDASEKSRRDKRRRLQSQYEYEAMQGKKMCPNCRSAQSYDEFVNNPRICPNEECHGKIEYKCPTTFKLKTFEKRMQKSIVRRHESMEKIREEQEKTRKKKRGQSIRQKQLSDKVEATGKGFLERMSDDVAKRKDKLSRLEETMREHEAKTCTFKPKLCIPKNLIQGRTSGSLLSEPSQRKTSEHRDFQTARARRTRRKAKRVSTSKGQKKQRSKAMVATREKMFM